MRPPGRNTLPGCSRDRGRPGRRRLKQRPAALEGAAGRQGKIPAATYSPTRKPCSTIGSGGLNCRVRDGNGWNPSDKATGKRNLCICASDVSSRRHCAALDPGLIDSVKQLEEKNDQAARAISIGQLNALPRLHLRPIDVVVYDGPSGGLRPGRPRLEVRFPLRCFQRLSSPDTATQRCHWRDNWYTGGPSNPVLSY